MRTKSAKVTVPAATTVAVTNKEPKTNTARTTPSVSKARASEAVSPQAPLRLWKDGTRRGIAYVEGREMAERVLIATGRAMPVPSRPGRDTDADLPGTMAVYRDKRGRAFAWQILFDMRCWDSVAALTPPATPLSLSE